MEPMTQSAHDDTGWRPNAADSFSPRGSWSLDRSDGKGEVQMVEELVRSYIGSPNTIILIALPMTDDMQNQKLRGSRARLTLLGCALSRADCLKQLQALPPKTKDPETHVLRLLSVFAQEARQIIQGSPEHTTLVQANKRRSYEKLFDDILATAPPFLPFDSRAGAPAPSLFQSRGRASSGAGGICLDTVRARIQSCLTRELPNNVPYAVKRAFIRGFQAQWAALVDGCFEAVEGTLKRVLVACIENHFSRFRVLKSVLQTVVLNLVDAHAAIARQQQEYLLKYESNPPSTQDTGGLAKLRSEWLATYRRAQATPARVSGSAQEGQHPTPPSKRRSGRRARCLRPAHLCARLGRLAMVPAGPLGPQNSNFGQSLQDRPDTHMLGPRCNSPNMPAYPSTSKAGADYANPAVATQQPPAVQDLYEEEMAFMAEIRAYFDIASKRLADNVPAAIDEHLLYSFSVVLFDTLVENLGITSDDASVRCAKYLAEDPNVAAVREDVEVKKRLDKVHTELCEFGLQAI
ncbi:hypothetical protein FKP32DRAFT_1680322 [Trametes sanguinea]|nr:hypothetical protein FKP32DRAFT_1680322 [Trametes sanguinea]